MIMNVEERLKKILELESELLAKHYYHRSVPFHMPFEQILATLMVAEQLESIAIILKNKRGV